MKKAKTTAMTPTTSSRRTPAPRATPGKKPKAGRAGAAGASPSVPKKRLAYEVSEDYEGRAEIVWATSAAAARREAMGELSRTCGVRAAAVGDPREELEFQGATGSSAGASDLYHQNALLWKGAAMSTLTNDCEDCGRSKAKIAQQWFGDLKGALCGVGVADVGQLGAADDCRAYTITRLKARVTELELIVGPRLRVWELSSGDVWVVAHTEDECWGHLENQHGNTDEVAERKENGDGWTALPDDKKITIYVDTDGDVCGYDDGAPCAVPAWVWAVRHGAGFLGETE